MLQSNYFDIFSDFYLLYYSLHCKRTSYIQFTRIKYLFEVLNFRRSFDYWDIQSIEYNTVCYIVKLYSTYTYKYILELC